MILYSFLFEAKEVKKVPVNNKSNEQEKNDKYGVAVTSGECEYKNVFEDINKHKVNLRRTERE